jgi:hypothetical protein
VAAAPTTGPASRVTGASAPAPALVTGTVPPVIARRVFVAAPVPFVTAPGGVPPACVVGAAGALISAAAAATVALATDVAAATPGTLPVAPTRGAAAGDAGAVPPDGGAVPELAADPAPTEPAPLAVVGGAEGAAGGGAEGTAAGEPEGGAECAAPEEAGPPGSGAVTEPSVVVTVPTTDPTEPVSASAEDELPEDGLPVTADVIGTGAGCSSRVAA